MPMRPGAVTDKFLGQDLLMMTILEDSACGITPTV